jgi:hypothetical protein
VVYRQFLMYEDTEISSLSFFLGYDPTGQVVATKKAPGLLPCPCHLGWRIWGGELRNVCHRGFPLNPFHFSRTPVIFGRLPDGAMLQEKSRRNTDVSIADLQYA